MSDCTHDCSTCGKDCGSKKESLIKPTHELSKIKRVIGVVSGKGGVGKSLVTSLLAVNMQRRNHKTAVIDADILGPSIPKMFGLKDKAMSNELGIMPVESKTGIKTMSINLLLENETDPVVWRGPVIGGVVTQFWTDVIWGEVDYMFIDMPPGTGDVALTVFQSIKLDGIVIVTSPQELVSMIVEKAVNMAKLMNVPILGLVENMSYVECPNCNEKFYLYGKSNIAEVASKYSLPVLAQIPIRPSLTSNADRGLIELYEGEFLDNATIMIETLLK